MLLFYRVITRTTEEPEPVSNRILMPISLALTTVFVACGPSLWVQGLMKREKNSFQAQKLVQPATLSNNSHEMTGKLRIPKGFVGQSKMAFFVDIALLYEDTWCSSNCFHPLDSSRGPMHFKTKAIYSNKEEMTGECSVVGPFEDPSSGVKVSLRDSYTERGTSFQVTGTTTYVDSNGNEATVDEYSAVPYSRNVKIYQINYSLNCKILDERLLERVPERIHVQIDTKDIAGKGSWEFRWVMTD